MLRSQALSALFNENVDSIVSSAIFLSTISGHLIGTSNSSAALPASLIKKACILATSTFAYHAEGALQPARNGTSSSDDRDRPLSSAATSLTASASTVRSYSSSSSANPALGSRAGYLSIQPLPLLARAEWSNQQSPSGGDDDDDDDEFESSLQRIIVEINVGRFIDSTGQGHAKAVSRLCAVESIGNGLMLGVLGPERSEDVHEIRDHSELERDGERDSDAETIDGDSSSRPSISPDDERDKKRQIRLLGVKTEALAEFVRGEFKDFKMPEVML